MRTDVLIDRPVITWIGPDNDVHASHLWGDRRIEVSAFLAFDSADVPAMFDVYPHRKSSTIRAALLLQHFTAHAAAAFRSLTADLAARPQALQSSLLSRQC